MLKRLGRWKSKDSKADVKAQNVKAETPKIKVAQRVGGARTRRPPTRKARAAIDINPTDVAMPEKSSQGTKPSKKDKTETEKHDNHTKSSSKDWKAPLKVSVPSVNIDVVIDGVQSSWTVKKLIKRIFAEKQIKECGTSLSLGSYNLYLVCSSQTGKGLWLSDDRTLKSYAIKASDDILLKRYNLTPVVRITLPFGDITRAFKFDVNTTAADLTAVACAKDHIDNPGFHRLIREKGRKTPIVLEPSSLIVDLGLASDEVVELRSILTSIVKVSIPSIEATRSFKIFEDTTVADLTQMVLQKEVLAEADFLVIHRRGEPLHGQTMLADFGMTEIETFEFVWDERIAAPEVPERTYGSKIAKKRPAIVSIPHLDTTVDVDSLNLDLKDMNVGMLAKQLVKKHVEMSNDSNGWGLWREEKENEVKRGEFLESTLLACKIDYGTEDTEKSVSIILKKKIRFQTIHISK